MRRDKGKTLKRCRNGYAERLGFPKLFPSRGNWFAGTIAFPNRVLRNELTKVTILGLLELAANCVIILALLLWTLPLQAGTCLTFGDF